MNLEPLNNSFFKLAGACLHRSGMFGAIDNPELCVILSRAV